MAEQLEKRSLVGRRTDDRGTFLVAADPSTLEVPIVTQEEILKQRRSLLDMVVPALTHLQGKSTRAFVVRTYEGAAGIKQCAWHELRTRGELLAFGNGTIEQMVSDPKWANRHRDHQISAGYRTKELINYAYPKDELPELASDKLLQSGFYSYRLLSTEILAFDNHTLVYNDTVAIYHWKYDQKVGVEVISPQYAQMMRQIFYHYWRLAQKP